MQTNKIFTRLREQMAVIDISNLNEDSLYVLFTLSKSWTIYVEDESKCIGVITLGDFKRYLNNNRELVNTNFTKFELSNEDDAAKLLQQKPWMYSVPVVDDKGCLVKEYYTSDNIFNNSYRAEFIYRMISRIVTEMNFAWKNLKIKRYSKVIFLTDALMNTQLERLRCKYCSNEIELKKYLTLNDLKQYAAEPSIFICDFCTDTYRVRKIFYDKYNISNTKWNLNEDEYYVALLEQRNYFSGVALLNGGA